MSEGAVVGSIVASAIPGLGTAQAVSDVYDGLREKDLFTENVAPRPPGREHSSRMLGGGPPPSLMIDQAMRAPRCVAPVRLIRAVP